ncbi:MAG: FGGY family carbohydrate kinase [Acidimicrobiales bacterium]|nr:FGGY family carbohydrate kinase [Acidimicrobiales bacterium]
MSLVLEISWSPTAVLALVHDRAAGQVVVEASVGHDPGNGHEQDPMAWWEAACGATRDVLAGMAAMGLPTDEFALLMVGVGRPPGGMVILDQRGEVVRPAVLGSHPASAADAEWLAGHVPGGHDAWLDATGALPGPGSTVALLSWLHRSDPDAWARLHRVTVPSGWLVERLTGQARLGAHDAVGTGVVDRRDPCRWRTDLLAVVDADIVWTDALPGLVLPADPAGGLTADAAATLGLAPLLPVHAGGALPT